jgi:hypothetical protein
MQTSDNNNVQWYSILGFCNLYGIKLNTQLSSRLGKLASKECKVRNIERQTVPDERWGKVYTYPHDILEYVFVQYFSSLAA